jgi:hypothetical protein
MHKELPLPGRVRDARFEKLAAVIGDLEVGQRVAAASELSLNRAKTGLDDGEHLSV